MRPIRFDTEKAGTLEWVPPLEVEEYLDSLPPDLHKGVLKLLQNVTETYLALVSTVFLLGRPTRDLGVVADGITKVAQELKKLHRKVS